MREPHAPMVSRRAFLQHCGTVGLGIGAGLLGIPRAAASAQPAGALRLGTLAPHVGSTFRFRSGRVDMRLRLISATRLAARSQSPAVRFEAFSLLFEAPRGADLPAGTYRISHPALSEFDLSVGPVGAAVQRRHEAVVTRLLP